MPKQGRLLFAILNPENLPLLVLPALFAKFKTDMTKCSEQKHFSDSNSKQEHFGKTPQRQSTGYKGIRPVLLEFSALFGAVDREPGKHGHFRQNGSFLL